MKKLCCAVLLALTAVWSEAACVRTLNPAEILQAPEHAKLATAYNLWYTDPLAMKSLNTHEGTILPFGTEVEIERATASAITFRTLPDRRRFRIEFEPEYRLQQPEDYLRELFTATALEDRTAGMRLLTLEKLRRGIVEKGMTRAEVLLAFGPPCAYRTPDRNASTWVYFDSFLKGRRVIFNGNRVLEVLVLK